MEENTAPKQASPAEATLDSVRAGKRSRLSELRSTFGPAWIVMIADVDAASIVTAAQDGASYGYGFVSFLLDPSDTTILDPRSRRQNRHCDRSGTGRSDQKELLEGSGNCDEHADGRN